jgi:hypothetical protein
MSDTTFFLSKAARTVIAGGTGKRLLKLTATGYALLREWCHKCCLRWPCSPNLARCRFLGILIVAAYTLINIILVALGPFTAGWPTWAVTALAVPPMVLAMVHVVIPIARRGGQT